jgi:hypothetical protein
VGSKLDADLHPGLALVGPEVSASRDEALTVAMQQHRLSIAEESLADVLLPDLM